MLQHAEPNDYVVATGEMLSVREFGERAFALLGLDWEAHIRFDARYVRPSEVDALRGDASRARELLGWAPRYTVDVLIEEMIANDLDLATQEKLLQDHGHSPGQRNSAR